MFFWKKKKDPTDLSWLQTDIHSHLIPGIDDGVPDLATSIALIKELQQLGYSKIITTPHILWEVYPNTAEIIQKGLADVKEEMAAQQINIELHAAAEYFIDEHFQSLLAKKTPLLTLRDNLVLVEFSMITAPLELLDILFELQLQRYQPLIAHPERYIYLRNKKEFFEELKNAGALFQLNLLSLMGHYGNAVQELAIYLLDKGYYDYAGTDLHNTKHMEKLQHLADSPIYAQAKAANLKNHLL